LLVAPRLKQGVDERCTISANADDAIDGAAGLKTLLSMSVSSLHQGTNGRAASRT